MEKYQEELFPDLIIRSGRALAKVLKKDKSGVLIEYLEPYGLRSLHPNTGDKQFITHNQYQCDKETYEYQKSMGKR